MPYYTVIYGSGPDFMPRSLLETVQIYTYTPNMPYTYSCIKALDLQGCAMCTCVMVT